MAMIDCPECGRRISDRADSCPGCGISQKTLREILVEQADLDASKVAKNVDIESKKTIATEPTVRPVTIAVKIVETTIPKITLKYVRCTTCNNCYRAEEKVCPKCTYPRLSVCGNVEKSKQLVKAYRKKIGIELVVTAQKGVVITKETVKNQLNLQVGQYYKMGCYQGEEISWKVLAVEDEKALLISEKGLDAKPYNKKFEDITWEGCTLKKWLNGEFYESAFTAEEKAGILKTSVTAEVNPKYNTNPGENTVDKVFLLSIQEANKYFRNDADRRVCPTEFAKNNGAYVDDRTKCCWWWLRSPGYISSSAASVDRGGLVDNGGHLVDVDLGCVRPALWMKLESGEILEEDNVKNIESDTNYLADFECDHNDNLEDYYEQFFY